jgi:4,5-dihydroxyphthalate decarboxylase
VRGGLEEAGRPEKIAINLPADVRLEPAPEGQTLSGMLAAGDIDAFMGPRVPSCFTRGHPHVGWLFADPIAAALDYYERTKIFPIMHIIGVRRTLVEQHRWLPVAALKAFERSKQIALDRLAETSSSRVTLPFIEEQLRRARERMGADFWSYGVPGNRHVLEISLRHHHAQGLSGRLVTVEELFHSSTFKTFKL